MESIESIHTMIQDNHPLTRMQYLTISQQLASQFEQAYDDFYEALTFKQYVRIKGDYKRYDRVKEAARLVSKSTKIHLLAAKAEASYLLYVKFKSIYPSDTGCK